MKIYLVKTVRHIIYSKKNSKSIFLNTSKKTSKYNKNLNINLNLFDVDLL